MAWVKFTTPKPGTQPMATLSSGILTLNRLAMELIGATEWIVLFYDSDTLRIGIGPASKGEPGCKRLRRTTNGGGGSISCVGLRDYYQIAEPQWYRLSPCDEYDVRLELSPSKRPVTAKAGRKRRVAR